MIAARVTEASAPNVLRIAISNRRIIKLAGAWPDGVRDNQEVSARVRRAA